jgi:hypothetical protein
VTDLEILENYANEFCEVLNSYDVDSKYLYEIKDSLVFVLKDSFTFAMLKEEFFENEKHVLSMTNFGGLFIDKAPFEKNKELSCED